MSAIPKSKLVLIGSISQEFKRMFSGKLPGTVEVLGPLPKDELKGYYSRADVTVLASVEDAFGYVMGEALACGCPVIATENTGGPDLLTDGVEGYIVPIRSPEAIAEKLVWIYRNPERAREMRRAALRRVRQMAGWQEYGLRLLNVYQNMREDQK